MKKFFSALLIFAFLFSLSACTEPPLEEPSLEESSLEEPTSTVAETESQTLHFMLNELPSLAPRQKDVIWEYLPGVTPDKFDTSLVYGALIPYIGESKFYQVYYEGKKWDDDMDGESSYNTKYGFMTTDGKIICDPIFENLYEIEDNKGKIFYHVKTSSMSDRNDYDSVINKNYLVAKDGSVAVDIGESEYIYDVYNDKILVGGFEKTELRLLDMKGKQIRQYDYDDNTVYSSNDGIIAVVFNAYDDNENRFIKFFNYDGKQILTDVVATNGFRDGLAAAKVGDKWGVIKTDGSWLIGASSEKGIDIYDEKFVIYRDGNVHIYDKSGKKLAEIPQSKYEADGTFYGIYDGVLCYYTWSNDGKELYYHIDDTPIACKKNNLQASAYSESNGKGLFLATDKAGTAYVFDIDGKLLNTVKQPFKGLADVYFSFDEYFYTVSFHRVSGSETTVYIYSAATNKLLKTLKEKDYDSKTNSYDNYYTEDFDEQFFIVNHHSSINGEISYEKSLCKVSDGSNVFEGSTDVFVTKLNGKYFYSVSYKNYIAVYDNDFKLIMKKFNANSY